MPRFITDIPYVNESFNKNVVNFYIEDEYGDRHNGIITYNPSKGCEVKLDGDNLTYIRKTLDGAINILQSLAHRARDIEEFKSNFYIGTL